MKMLQTFFNELEDREEIEKSPFRRLGKERKRTIMRERYDKPIYLKQSELQAIMDAEVPECLEDTRQAFTLQCAFWLPHQRFQGIEHGQHFHHR